MLRVIRRLAIVSLIVAVLFDITLYLRLAAALPVSGFASLAHSISHTTPHYSSVSPPACSRSSQPHRDASAHGSPQSSCGSSSPAMDHWQCRPIGIH